MVREFSDARSGKHSIISFFPTKETHNKPVHMYILMKKKKKQSGSVIHTSKRALYRKLITQWSVLSSPGAG